MSFKRKLMFIFLILLAAYILYFVYVSSHPEIMYSEEFAMGNKIVKKIEIYIKVHKKLPSKLEDIGERETMEGPIFYQKFKNERYSISFGTVHLGESYVYNSEKKKWNLIH